MEVVSHTNTPAAETAKAEIPIDRRVHVGDPLPNTMSANELMQALNLKPWVFFKHQRAGKFKRFEFKRPIGHKRYSGRLVAAYLERGA